MGQRGHLGFDCAYQYCHYGRRSCNQGDCDTTYRCQKGDSFGTSENSTKHHLSLHQSTQFMDCVLIFLLERRMNK